MNKEQILQLKAGEELDNLVIKEIMHHEWDDGERPRCKTCGVWKDWPSPAGCGQGRPSTDIRAAQQVMEKLFNDGWREQRLERDHRTGMWEVEFGIGELAFAESMSLPEAISKAALLTILAI